jgi:predicted GIY-YIG superfamily endonuclease
MTWEWEVYALLDPRDNSVRYVGSTSQPQIRFRQHKQLTLKKRCRNYEKYLWEQRLRSLGLKPIWKTLETSEQTEETREACEKKWINHYYLRADILNIDMVLCHYGREVNV